MPQESKPVLPFLLTANVYLITLYSAFKRIRITLRIEQTYLLKHIPSSHLSHLHVSCKFIGTNALLIAKCKMQNAKECTTLEKLNGFYLNPAIG